MTVMVVQTLGVLAKRRQCRFALDNPGLVERDRWRHGGVATQVIGDLTREQRVLPGRTGQGNGSRGHKQPQRNHPRPAYRCSLDTDGQQLQQWVREWQWRRACDLYLPVD
ncbi:hypothetical protein D3C85_1224910 [compost metagenome]